MIEKIGGSVNKKGQALIEFVLILPVFIFILFAVIDFGLIFNTKSNLENDSSDIIELYTNGMSIEELRNLYPDNNLIIEDNGKYYKFNISTSINIMTPGLNLVLGNPYQISIERIVPHA